MNCARNHENLLNFVTIMPKILMVPFYSRHGVGPMCGNNVFLCQIKINTCLSSVDPVPRVSTSVDRPSSSVNPDRCVAYELLKDVINVLICDDRQCWISSRTKPSRFIPTQHWTAITVETIVLAVQRVTPGHLDCLHEAGRLVTYKIKCILINMSTIWL